MHVADEPATRRPLVAELDHSSMLLRAVSASGIGLFEMRDSRFSFVNDAFARMTGYAPAELTAPEFDPVTLALPEEESRVQARMADMDAGRTGERAAFRLRRKDGTILVVESVAVTPGLDDARERLVIVQDVTARHLAEKDAAEKQELYETLLRGENDLRQGVVVANGLERIVYANDAYCELTGYSRDELLSESWSNLRLYPPETLALIRERSDFLAQGKSVPPTFEIEILRKDGARRWVEVAVTTLPMRGMTTRIAILRDATQRRADDEQVARMRAQLARMEKLSAIGQLVSGVAHELRTPLAYLSNNVFLMETKLRRAVEAGEARPEILANIAPLVQDALSGIDRLNQLVLDLRRFGKASGERMEGLVADAVQDASRLFEATHRGAIRLERDIARGRAVADMVAVQQIVINLLENAADASLPGGTVTLRVNEDATHVRIEVADHGAGISSEAQERIFEPFFTTKSSGTGLGLSIVKRILDELHGSIRWESAPGKGTRFVVRIPLPTRAEAPGGSKGS